MKYVLIVLLFCVGCYTAKKAEQQVVKAGIHHPEVLAKVSQQLFPSKDSVIYKDSVQYYFDTLYLGETYFDTIRVDDTVFITKVLPPKVITQVITKTKEVFKTDTREQFRLNNIIDGLVKHNNQLQKERDDAKTEARLQKKDKRAYRNILLVIVIAVLGYFILKFKKILP